MDTIQQWLIDVGVKKMGPSAIRGSILGIIGWLTMKNNLIPGIHTDSVSHITTIAWDQVSTWAIAGLPAVVAAIIKMVNHQGTAIISKPTQQPETI